MAMSYNTVLTMEVLFYLCKLKFGMDELLQSTIHGSQIQFKLACANNFLYLNITARLSTSKSKIKKWGLWGYGYLYGCWYYSSIFLHGSLLWRNIPGLLGHPLTFGCSNNLSTLIISENKNNRKYRIYNRPLKSRHCENI